MIGTHAQARYVFRMSTEIVAKLLAGEHMSQDRGIREVYWAPAANEVRLIEVSGSVEDTGELLPFRFSPDPPDVPFQSVVILVSPGDWRRVTSGDLMLPESFGNIGDLERIAQAG
jgi:hypothetical protein